MNRIMYEWRGVTRICLKKEEGATVDTPIELNLVLHSESGELLHDPDVHKELVGKLIHLIITWLYIHMLWVLWVVSSRATQGLIIKLSVYRIFLKRARYLYDCYGHLNAKVHYRCWLVGVPRQTKSTTRYCTPIGGDIVSWKSKK